MYFILPQIIWIFFNINLVNTRYCCDIGFLLDFHRDVHLLRIYIEVTSLYDTLFQYHNDVVTVT